MAFVTVRRGSNTARVSMKAFENIYKKNGYVLEGVKEQTAYETEHAEETTEETSNAVEVIEEVAEEDIEMIPISDMNKEQLAEYAKKHDIDTSSAKSVREARNIVKEEVRKRSL